MNSKMKNLAEKQCHTFSSPLPIILKEKEGQCGYTTSETFRGKWLLRWNDGVGLLVLVDLPRTCFSRPSMTWTACWRMISLVWALSLCRWTWHILPSSLKASLMSRTRTLSLALLARRRSRSLCSFSSAVRFSSVTETMLQPGEGRLKGPVKKPNHKPN